MKTIFNSPSPASRPYYECPVCGFKRSHRFLSGGYDGFLAKWRVQLHMLLNNHLRSRS